MALFQDVEVMPCALNLFLTIVNRNVQYTMSEHSMSEVARKIEVQRATLYEWMRKKKIPPPKRRMVSGVRFCFWTSSEVEQIKKYKDEHYREKPTLRKKRGSQKSK